MRTSESRAHATLEVLLLTMTSGRSSGSGAWGSGGALGSGGAATRIKLAPPKG